MKSLLLAVIATFSSAWGVLPLESNAPKIRRFAFVIGKNSGGLGRTPLKYAASDAQSFTKVMEEFGGLDNRDAIVLLNPTRKDFLSRFQDVQAIVGKSKDARSRTELFLYYSGHSDDNGLLLDGEKLTYKELKKEIANVSADLSVVILDSCASGSLTRVKGGMRRAPFLEDSLSKLKGYVVLTSSSAKEASQESDRVKGSFFTHYLVSGVRGAADVNQDNKVTLNEAYQYAFHQTLARTERTVAGPQHPSYSIELAGSGELVMTDIRNTNSRIVFENRLLGRFYVRDKDDKLIAEIDKPVPKALSIGLEPGVYSITSIQGGRIASATAAVGPNHALRLASNDFQGLEGEKTALRGDNLEGEIVSEEDEIRVPAEFSILPGVSSNVFDSDHTVNNFHLSLLHARSLRVEGAAISLFGFNRARTLVRGLQLSPGANIIDSGPLSGVQFAFGYNSASAVKGAQIGAWNQATTVAGGQGGGVALADSVQGIQAGLAANIAHASVKGLQFGAWNQTPQVRGGQFGGINLADSVTGAQVALGASISRESLSGFQLSSLNIVQGPLAGGQLGFANYASGEVRGGQVGGANYANKLAGAQVGFVNIADDLDGVQIGLFNKSRGKNSVPIGLINVVEGGMVRLGYGFNERQFHQLQFRHGSQNAYSIFQYGFRAADNTVTTGVHMLGVGLGGQWTGKYAFAGMEGLMNYTNMASFTDIPVWMPQLRLLVGFRVTNWMSVAGGPTLNGSWVDLSFMPAWATNLHSISAPVWVGYHVGVEFWL